jgi:hypothetical protein
VGVNTLMKAVYEAAEFMWKLRMRMRFGELSRAPLQLLRFEIAAESATCEWLSRDADPWDRDTAPAIRDRNSTLQALRDAIALRQMLFSSIPEIREAKFRVYRRLESQKCALIITGLVSKRRLPASSWFSGYACEVRWASFFDSGRRSRPDTNRR